MSAVLEAMHLAKFFGGLQAVHDVSFEVAAGEMLAMIGPNGAGKTTCFNLLNGQLVPDAGRVKLDGRDVVGLSPRAMWRLGVGRTFQITATFPSLTVRENIQLTLASHHRRLWNGWAPASELYCAEADRLLDRIGMREQAERACAVLAYGDLKRVEFAIALAHDPRLLLMDEPTAGMAPKERVELMALVSSVVRERKIAALFTEHDMDVVFAHADRIIVLNRGRLIAAGKPNEVRQDPEVQQVYLGSGSYH